MTLLAAVDFSLPLADPILKFLLILLIILAAPLVLNRLKIPHLIGLIIAGAVIGPFGFNLVLRDSSIIMSGTAGLLYIMFLAGLEIDMGDFKRNSGRSLAFGLYTFCIPMALGTAVGIWVLQFSVESSVLLASMFASHTLIAYPIVSKLGISKNPAVGITVGGTMITDTLALLVLAVVVGMATGQADEAFWWRMGISTVLFAAVVLVLFPLICRWFFKWVQDSISQYIFVLAMVFLGAFLAQMAGLEGIIGSFLAGLALNRLIPNTSPLMNRIEFVGNSIFIPFFLISVGMLVDYRAFFTSWETIEVGAVMVVVATAAKWAAAWATQKSFGLSIDQRRIIFGLSNAQAAATLAAVMVGYNVVLGTDADGEPIRLLNEAVLNGTILMILVTCTMASFSTQRGAHNIAAAEAEGDSEGGQTAAHGEHILIPMGSEATAAELIELSLAIRDKRRSKLSVVHVVDNHSADERQEKTAHKLLHTAAHTAAGANAEVNEVLRYDLNIANGILGTAMEVGATDVVLGVGRDRALPAWFKSGVLDGVLPNGNVNVFVYRSAQPLGTVKRHLVVWPVGAEKEAGFGRVAEKLRRLAQNTSAKLVCYGSAATLRALQKLAGKRGGEVEYAEFTDWGDFLILFRDVRKEDSLCVVLSRREGLSYDRSMAHVPAFLSKYLPANNFVLVYPMQAVATYGTRYLT